MKERFQASDFRFLAICAVLLAGATWFSVRNFYRAFPEASIDFRVSRAEGETLAARFLGGQGYKLGGYREASSFNFDNGAKTFLERELGLEKANQIMGARMRLWRWSYRWFRPLQKEEFRADLTPAGALAGFEHDLPEDAARPAMDEPEARARAEAFLRGTMHRDPASLDFVEVEETVRPHRTDRAYTWKERDFNLHEATYRLEVSLAGGEVAGYREYLKIPEQWTRDFEALRSKNDASAMVDAAFMVALFAGLIVIIVMRVRRQDVRWRRAMVVGGIGMVLTFLSQLNGLPLSEFHYATTDSYESFIIRQVLSALMAGLGAGGLLFVLTAGAETVYREMFPEKISLGSLFVLRGLRTKRFFMGAALGIALTALFFAYQTAFYIVASHLGAWSPADVPYDDMLNTRFPWLFVLFGGFFPAVSEEFMFRMFGIPFLRKLARSTVVAVVVAGLIWGFGHTNYPNEPFYIRGVEVGIGGIALGFVMLRWGILPTLVWHYSIDAMYTAMLLMRSHSWYFRLSGAASAGIIVLPVVVSLAAYWRKGGFEPEAGLLNADEPPPAEAPAVEAAPSAEMAQAWQPLSGRMRMAALALAAAGAVALAVPAVHFGDQPHYRLSAEQVRAVAARFLGGQGMNLAGFQDVTVPEIHWGDNPAHDGLAGKYFLEREDVPAASRMFARYRPVHFWMVRYFQSLNQEEARVTVHPETGQVLGFEHVFPEDKPGADIGDEAARGIAAAFAASLGQDTGAMDLKESQSEKKPKRRDHTLVWEARAGDARNLGEAHFRVEVGVAGDRPATLAAYWKLPEDYLRARERQNFISIGVIALRFGVIGGLAVYGLWLVIRQIRQGSVRWRITLTLAGAGALLTATGTLLTLPLLAENYPTAVPLGTFRAMTDVSLLISVMFAFLVFGAAAALVTSCYPDVLPAMGRKGRGALGLDALFALAAAAGLALVVRQAEMGLAARFHAQALFDVDSERLAATVLPSLSALASLREVLINGATLALAAVIFGRLARRWMPLAAGLLAAFVALPLDIRTPGEFALEYGMGLAGIAAVAAFCVFFGRNNYVAYALVLAVWAVRAPLAELFGNPMPGLALQGWIAAAGLGAIVVWAVAPAMGRAARGAGAGS